MITKHIVKTCCGKTAFIMEADKPIRKYQLPLFEAAGFVAPESFQKIGVFYIRGKGIMAGPSPFGTKKIKVHCAGKDCDERISEFEELLESALSTKP